KLLKNLSTEPFDVTFWDGSTIHYNDGISKFRLTFNKPLNRKSLKENPMIALAEGYMDKDIEVEGHLEYVMETIFSKQSSFINQTKKKLSKSTKKEKKNQIRKHDYQKERSHIRCLVVFSTKFRLNYYICCLFNGARI